jgi:probable HAF family extracellular repeat protein
MIVGYALDASSATQAFQWTAATGMVGLGFLNSTGFKDSRARALGQTNTGTPSAVAIVGESTSPGGHVEAFIWRPTSGMSGLGDLPGGEFRSVALATSYAGQRVFGWSDTADGSRAFVWDEANGMRDLKTVLESEGYNVAGWTLLRVNAVSLGGGVVVGDGVNPLGHSEGWIARPACWADCNADNIINVQDFGCFQTRFVSGDPYADCNGSGTLNVQDFGCFRNAVVAGCE